MEKVIYLLWSDALATQKQTLACALQQAGATKVRVNVADDAVSAGAALRIATSIDTLPDGIVSCWLDSSYQRQDLETALSTLQLKYFGYSVCESEPMPNTQHPAVLGERCEGFNQVVLLQKPEQLNREQWLAIWLNSHTQIAIDTQQTFGYRQNIVVRRFDERAPALDAIIEENFPIGALTDDKVFYAPDLADQKPMVQQMFDSCVRFIDFKRMNRLITSEYNY